MEDAELMVDGIIQDFGDLERELNRELLESDSTDISRLMQENDYWEQIQQIRERILRLMEALNRRIHDLRNGIPLSSEEGRDDFVKNRFGEIESLISQLNAVWERLQTLVGVIEYRLSQTKAGTNSLVTRAKGWLSIIKNWIQRISSQLWSLLSRLLTPKEWKLGGKVGTGPFGLADVSVEITFGT